MSAESLILFFIVGAFLVGIALLFSSYIPPTSTNPQKSETYECGIPTEGLSWLQFNVGYYLFAIIFLVFDVETIFLLPFAVAFTGLSVGAFVAMIIFLLLLVEGLVWAWRKGILNWH